MTEPLMFESTMDALVRAAGARLPESCVARLKETGLDLSTKLRPAYPSSVWSSSVRIVAEELFPGTAPAEAHRQLGARSVDVFADGVMGSALFGLLRLIGPTRTIGRMTKNLRTGANFLETRATQLSPNSFDIWINEVNDLETFYQGLLEAGLRHVGAKELKVVVTSCDSHQCTYRATWAG